jgi:hypothetical protein
MQAKEVTDGIFRLSANIGSDVLFEGIWPLPHGASRRQSSTASATGMVCPKPFTLRWTRSESM